MLYPPPPPWLAGSQAVWPWLNPSWGHCRQHIRQHPHHQHHCVFMQSSLPSWLSSHFVPYPWGRNCDSRTHFVLWAFSVEVGALSMMVLRVEDLAVSAPLDFGQANWSAFLKCFTLNSRWIGPRPCWEFAKLQVLIWSHWHMLAHVGTFHVFPQYEL